MFRFCDTVSAMNVVLPTRMTVDEFLAWGVCQEKGRYELFDGRVVMQQPQNWGHAQLSLLMYSRLVAAIERAGVPFYAAPVGMTVRIADGYAFEPDALVAPLPKPRQTDLEIPDPVIVVEVLSPSTARRDRTDKLAGYFKVPSVEHYLIVSPQEHEVIWYHRGPDGGHAAPVPLREGTLELDPPGIVLDLSGIFPTE
jgi:Uma2 family endonuclease